jgi:phosphomannomutase
MSVSPESITNIFKAYDIRGKVGSELTTEVSQQIGQALGAWLPKDEGKPIVAVGRDMRPDSAELANALIEGVTAAGYNVWDIGEVTSDMIYFVVGHYGLAGGAMITASHNPGEYNGIKVCREGARPIGQDTGLFEIRDAVINGAFQPADKPGGVETKDVVEDWIQHTLSFINAPKLKEQRIAVDAGNGMAGKIFPELEPYVPWEVTEMYFELDGTFPNHEANPLKFETLTDLINKIKSDKLNGGIAFDGDGDRAFLVDETGEVMPGSVMISLLAEYFLEHYPESAILYDVRTSKSVKELIEARGGKPVRTKVGHSFIKQIMREENAPFGGEVSGHFYFRDNFFADSGLIGAVIGLYVAGLRGKTLSQIREQYAIYPVIPETNFTVQDKDAAIERIRAAFPDAKEDTLDGLTIWLNDGSWFNVRGSNTEPVLRLNAEAESKYALQALVSKVTGLIEAA